MEWIDLAEMRRQEKGRVVSIQGGFGLVRRLAALGIRPGVIVTKVSSRFMGGPVIVRIGNTELALGFGMARKVVVERTGQESGR